ncbi:GlsB/YeaQ/YmgE family stress response membrane protein [Kaistia terrae]|uniref:GlsB/YeaQ/YmgE family stress response membrane protein n=1 Tax=Kaistia terrae TaxID=537017 RepID=A0ABW0Q1G2_9HYPH|nr:GlsB/YeaQ/YmgE family stress response membrane protein [Kaistia terrae]MCX5578632.1 GlsB/YeaQ/YmgE family stress response membrane protein [Kaistia terrae]
MDPQLKAILIWVAIGLIAGWLASIVVGGGGLIRNIITGLIGAVVGGFLVRYFNIPVDLGNEFVNQVVIAAVGAVIVVGLAKLIA